MNSTETANNTDKQVNETPKGDKQMNKKQTIAMIEAQCVEWDNLYTVSKAKDAGLVLSVLESVLHAMKTGNGFSQGEYAGMLACYGSDDLKDMVFPKYTK